MAKNKDWPADSVELVELSAGDQFQIYDSQGNLCPTVWTRLPSSSLIHSWEIIDLLTLKTSAFQQYGWPVKKVGNYFKGVKND